MTVLVIADGKKYDDQVISLENIMEPVWYLVSCYDTHSEQTDAEADNCNCGFVVWMVLEGCIKTDKYDQ